MSFTNAFISAMEGLKTRGLLVCEQQKAIDARFFTYCWNYNQVDARDYLVVEVEDLTKPMQMDDASSFMDSITSESAETINCQWVF